MLRQWSGLPPTSTCRKDQRQGWCACAQVLWAGFEWLLDQIGDEMEELYVATATLMASLPYPL